MQPMWEGKYNPKSISLKTNERPGIYNFNNMNLSETEEVRIVHLMRKDKWTKSTWGVYVNAHIEDLVQMLHLNKIGHDGYQMPNASGIQELHDLLTRDNRTIREKNVEFKYSSKILKLECSIDDIEFRLPKGSHELIDIGNDMHHCVGSYASRVIEGERTIIVAYKNNERVVCLDITKTYELNQAKAHYNKPPYEYYETLIKFCSQNKINYKECFDIHMAKTKPQQIVDPLGLDDLGEL
jgi:hypothetical protein